jgi:hypothetical protein
MTSRMASRDVYCRARLFISAVSELWTFTPYHEQWFVIIWFEFVLYSGLAFAWVFNACVDPLYDFQVIYWALTRQLTIGWYFTIA